MIYLLHQDELLVLSISFSLIDDKLLAKDYIFPLTVISVFLESFKSPFCKLCYLKIDIERTSIVWHFFQFELNFVCGSECIRENISK